jgi:hypothetical protein
MVFGMMGVSETKDIARELQDHMLEASAGSEAGQEILASEADG